jgi:radical SAM protein with 4Fe4S-binding SPASM domain
MIKYAKSKNMYVITYTNLNNIPSGKEVVESGVDQMLISLDGTCQETYGKYKVNGSFQKVIDNIFSIKVAKQALGKTTPEIVLKFVIFKHNEHEIEAFRQLCEQIGDVVCQFSPAVAYIKEDCELFEELYSPKNEAFKIFGRALAKDIPNKCNYLWANPCINWDGEMAVCCADVENSVHIGNISENSFLKLWKSDNYQRFRKAVLTNRSAIEMCSLCIFECHSNIIHPTPLLKEE